MGSEPPVRPKFANDGFRKPNVSVCGCEISAQEVRLAVVRLDDEGKVEMFRPKTTRIELEDDTSEADLRSFMAALHEFARENQVETFAIKTRAKKGRMSGGAVSFKIETLRHAAASLFIEQGWNPKKIQTLLGHASINMTMDVYGHLFKNAEEDVSMFEKLEMDLMAA